MHCQTIQRCHQESNRQGHTPSGGSQAFSCHLPSTKPTFRPRGPCDYGARFGRSAFVSQRSGDRHELEVYGCRLGCVVHVRHHFRRPVCKTSDGFKQHINFFPPHSCSLYRGSTVEFTTCLNLTNPQFVASTNPQSPTQQKPSSPFNPRFGPHPSVQPAAGQQAASGFRPAPQT